MLASGKIRVGARVKFLDTAHGYHAGRIVHVCLDYVTVIADGRLTTLTMSTALDLLH